MKSIPPILLSISYIVLFLDCSLRRSHPVGSAFQQVVWALLLEIPYGETTTYGTLARKLAEK